MTRVIPAVTSRGVVLGGNQTAVMGILNVTPDSFSDGGLWTSESAAIAHGIEMTDEGATVIDVGGESTRPGARRVDAEEEWQRVGRVIEGLVREGVLVSIDTVRSETAKRAMDAGAVLVNDVSGGVLDPRIAEVASHADCAMVVQHWRGFPSDPDLDTSYQDVVSEVVSETLDQVRGVTELGLPAANVIIDPGLGFGLVNDDSWKVVDSLDRLVESGFPVLVGGSRKRFVASRYGNELEQGTLDVTRACVEAGVWMVRVHQVLPNVRLIRELTQSQVKEGQSE